MENKELEIRLEQLAEQLHQNSSTPHFLGTDWRKVVVNAIVSGFPSHTVIQCAVAIEALLKELLNIKNRNYSSTATLDKLLQLTQNIIPDRLTLDYIRDIQRTRNRASHHTGSDITQEDAIDCVRKITIILDWFQSYTFDTSKKTNEPLHSSISYKVKILTGLLRVLGYKKNTRSFLSPSTVYLLYVNQRGASRKYLEFVISRSHDDLTSIYNGNVSPILNTSFPLETRYLILDEDLQFDTSISTWNSSTPLQICTLHQIINKLIGYDKYRDHILKQENYATVNGQLN